jgi:hypothetical protein
MPPRPNTLIFLLFIYFLKKKAISLQNTLVSEYFDDAGLVLFGTLGAWYAVTW